jgi:AAA15 family ATPase/GTPase
MKTKREQEGDILMVIKLFGCNYARDLILIKSIFPYYFCDFKDIEYSIRLDSKIIIIEGRNSQGKTSLGESIEWLFTGKLSRRTSKDLEDS